MQTNNKWYTSYKFFWIIWTLLALAGISKLLANPNEFISTDSRLLTALLVLGVAFLLRQKKIIFTKPTRGEFILGAVLLLIAFPFLWVGTILLWSGIVRDLRKK